MDSGQLMSDYSDKVNGLVAKLKEPLGLKHWTIGVAIGRNEALGFYNDGFARTDAKYCNATLDIAPDLEADRLTHVVYHEMLHVALAEFKAPLALFAYTLSAKQKEYLDALIDYQEERLIEQVVPGLIELIEE